MPLRFNFLTSQSAREAKISDHDPIIFGEFFVWNIMMQGNYNEAKKRYNNGLMLSKESQKQYQQRLVNIVKTIAEACHLNSDINIIALEEAPIREEDIQIFIDEFKKHKVLSKFFLFIDPSKFTELGVVTLINTQKYEVQLTSSLDKPYSNLLLEKRLQEFVLIDKHTGKQHYMTNLHLPFDLAKSEKRIQLFAFIADILISQKSKVSSLTFMGDFNFNPILLFQTFKFLSGCIPQNNNTLVEIRDDKIESLFDTVDAVASTREIKCDPPRDAKSFSFSPLFSFFHDLPMRLPKIIKKDVDDQEKSKPDMSLVLSVSYG